jgi:ribonuclease HII
MTDIADTPKKARGPAKVLEHYYSADDGSTEIGVDEVGRGPMLGRVYSAAVILPKDESFNHALMKDSKRFHSKIKILEAYEYIKDNCVAWNVSYSSESIIDKINIRNATHRAMHEAIKGVMKPNENVHLLIDGSDFKPYTIMKEDIGIVQVPTTCIVGGDDKYTAIAAASIMAKVTRDKYIENLCEMNPILDEKYGILSNKGYGTKTHMDGIKAHGITKFHRRSFGICRGFSLPNLDIAVEN